MGQNIEYKHTAIIKVKETRVGSNGAQREQEESKRAMVAVFQIDFLNKLPEKIL